MGYVEGETVEKVALSLTAIASIVISVISIMTKVHLRSPIFILLIGLWVALDKLLPCIITLSLCIILDEVVFTPLAEHYKSLYVINAEIDKRNK